MPTPDEQTLVPSLGVEPVESHSQKEEDGEFSPTAEAQAGVELTVSNQSVDTLLGKLPPSEAVNLGLKFRELGQNIPRPEALREDESVGSSQKAQAIMDNARMDEAVGGDTQSKENTQPAPQEQREITAETFLGSHHTSEVASTPEQDSQTQPNPSQQSSESASGEHNHNLDLMADPDELEAHGHGGPGITQNTGTNHEDIPKNPESADFAGYLQAKLERDQQETMNRLQQAS